MTRKEFSPSKIEQAIEKLEDSLATFRDSVVEGERDPHAESFLLDELLDVQEILHANEVEEGRFYDGMMLVVDHPIKLFDIVTVERIMSGTSDTLQVMSIQSVKPGKDGKLIVEFLAQKIK